MVYRIAVLRNSGCDQIQNQDNYKKNVRRLSFIVQSYILTKKHLDIIEYNRKIKDS